MEDSSLCKIKVRKSFGICLIIGILCVCYLTFWTRGKGGYTFNATSFPSLKILSKKNRLKFTNSTLLAGEIAANSYQKLFAAAAEIQSEKLYLQSQGYLNENKTYQVSEPSKPPIIVDEATASERSDHAKKASFLSPQVYFDENKTRASDRLSDSSSPRLAIRTSRPKDQLQQSWSWTCKDALEAERKRNNITRIACRDIFENIVETCSNCPASEPLGNFFFQETQNEALKWRYREANLAFVHIPKSAGTSVEGLLKSYLKHVEHPCAGCKNTRRVQVAHCSHFDEAILYHDSVNRTFWFSKRPFGLHRFIEPARPFLYFIWFRDPVERVVSTYYYLKRLKPNRHPLTRRYIRNSRNLQHFLSFDVPFPDFDNFNVRLLQFGEFLDVDSFFEECCGAYEGRENTFLPPIKKEHYEVAKRNLERQIGFVGLLEDFKTSQDMLCDILGIPRINRTIRINSNLHRTNITDYEKKEIERRNFWDIKLYEHAKIIYDRQKEKYKQIKEFL